MVPMHAQKRKNASLEIAWTVEFCLDTPADID
jgi:hypothetical protein